MSSSSSSSGLQIEVAPPVSRQCLSETLRLDRIYAGPPDPASPGGERREKVAVLVCHGMGQQVPFEHIDLISDAVVRGAEPGCVKKRAEVRFAALGDQRLPRAEILVQGPEGEREVHVYEAYWAPLTEGKVSASDVTRFLFDAGFRGIEYALRGHFDRWMMGRWRPFRLGPATLGFLVFAFLAVCAGLLMYGALGFAVGVRAADALLRDGMLAPAVTGLADRLVHELFRSPLRLTLLIFPALAALWTWRAVKWVFTSRRAHREAVEASTADRSEEASPRRDEPKGAIAFLRRHARVPTAVAALATAVWTLVVGVWIVLAVARTLAGGGVAPADGGRPLWYELLFLASAVAGCLWIRSFYIQFLGDVAVYLSSHKLNEFDALRTEIKKIGVDVGCAIYSALDQDGNDREYDGVVVVGHSLGSVVAYDTLNAVLNRDASLGGDLRAEDRTLGLITFGSPLDKSAFIFRTQKERSEIREALAAAVQPLIETPSCREKIHWVNIHSRMDPVSGPVDFYDPPAGTIAEGELTAHRRVENQADPQATVYGEAHTSYWTNDLLAQQLWKALTRPAPARIR